MGYYRLSLFIKQRGKTSRVPTPAKYIVYTRFRVHPNFNHLNRSLAVNLFKTLHKNSSLPNWDFKKRYCYPCRSSSLIFLPQRHAARPMAAIITM